ncbi:hypothetical protein AVEN_73732-1 [Araneus ventricosus]|uniref:Uncharacterized protein n=1 Tax=Araneus ventricosus TaxID=182803 RepID=A0A4Y2H5U9_ARAVE|nr:hypothetical protein AVEN_73732-1 [Araneus ventricosus]
MPSAKVVDSFGTIALKTFVKKNDTGLKTIKIQNLGSIRAVSEVVMPSISDLLWLYGKWVDLPKGGHSLHGFWNARRKNPSNLRKRAKRIVMFGIPSGLKSESAGNESSAPREMRRGKVRHDCCVGRKILPIVILHFRRVSV